MTKCRIFTGPVWVGQIADKLRAGGYDVTSEGTEHVTFLAELGGWGLLDLAPELKSVLGWEPKQASLSLANRSV